MWPPRLLVHLFYWKYKIQLKLGVLCMGDNWCLLQS